MKSRELLNEGAFYLKERGVEEAELNSQLILSYLFGKEKFRLYLDEEGVSSSEEERFWQYLKKRGSFYPLQYLIGSAPFFNFEFLAREGAFIPRPETEILVEAALNKIQNSKFKIQNDLKILDLCAGSGNIGITLSLLSKSKVWLTDISESALSLARENARRLGVENRVIFKKGNLFEPVNDFSFDLILSNPPYIPSSEIRNLPEEVGREPRISLDGGKEGLFLIRRIIREAPFYLRKKGFLIFEIGYNQAESVKNYISENNLLYLEEIIPDYQGIPRVVIVKKHGEDSY